MKKVSFTVKQLVASFKVIQPSKLTQQNYLQGMKSAVFYYPCHDQLFMHPCNFMKIQHIFVFDPPMQNTIYIAKLL